MGSSGMAVIGMGVRYPHAGSLAEFRSNLRNGRDSVRELPAARIAATGMDPDTRYLPMGYLDEVDRFDHAFFGLSRREAELLEPQHRLAHVLTQAALDDAGYPTSWFTSRRTAVIFSLPSSDYERLVPERSTLAMTGTWPGGMPARIAHRFGMTGPCYGIDTGCNGSLVAVHHAARELLAGDAEYALVGGVNVRSLPPAHDHLDGFPEIMSTSGRCRAFDEAADGAVGGEGGAVLLLTTVDRAVAEGARIHAVIAASAVLHNGHHSATISTPSARAQAEVVGEAWRRAGLDVADADYVEAHGSGTRLGDAVEVEGLALARGGNRVPLPIGSVKTNIGHLDNAAGVTGLVKVILGVRHGELYPSLHFRRSARGVDLDAAGLRVVTSAQAWPEREDGSPRRAGVSSFSLGGLNAHCVVEQAPAAETAPDAHVGPVLVGVSARSRSALTRLCVRLAGELRSGAEPLADIAFTLNEGRDHHRHRIAVLADSTSELAEALEEHVLSGSSAEPTSTPRVVVALSGNAVTTSPAEPVALPAALPLRGTAAAWQLGMYRTLTSAVGVDGVLASGRSRYLARWVRGELSDVDTAELAAGTAPDLPADPAKLADAIDRLVADGPVVVVELGVRGDITAALPERDGVHREAVASPDDLPRLVGRLYELGVDVDWSALRADTRPPRRVSLPGHPLEGVRCWVGSEPESTPAAVEEDTSVGAQVRSVLAGLLRADDVAADADFFELGGNSVVGLQVMSELTRRFEVEVRLVDIYEHRAVSDLVEHVERLRGALVPAVDESRLPPVTPGDEYVLSFGQERMWFQHQVEPGTTMYNLSSRMRITGPFDPDAWRAALEDFARRHETIRSNFVDDGGEARLVIRPDLGDFCRIVDLSEEDDPAVAERLVAEHFAHSFDLAVDPLYRVLVLRHGPEDHLVANLMHHAVNDGHAPTILRDELTEMYAARLEGRPYRLAPLPVQYRDHARWQREVVGGSALDGQVAFWRRTLRDAPVLDLPTDLPRPARMNHRGEFHLYEIPADVVRRLRALAVEESSTSFVVLLAALNVLLSRLSGQQDIVVATPTAGRSRPEVWGLLGYFNNTVLFRNDLSGRPSFRDFVRGVRQVVLDAMDNEDLPFDAVVRAVAPPRDPSRNTLFDVMYTHQALPRLDELENGPFRMELEYGADKGFPGLQPGNSLCDLAFSMVERPDEDEIVAVLEYSTQLFYRPTVVAIADAFVEVLREVVGDPDREVEPTEWRVTRVFERQVARTPRETALVSDGAELDYAGLNARVNRLAHLLIRRGIGPEDRVALALPRTPDLVVAVLAVLKAGAVHVPVDPEYPAARKAFLLTDSAPALVITTSGLDVPDDGVPRLLLDDPDTASALGDCPAADPVDLVSPLRPEHAAYVMYTSGSTGDPKGVVVDHAALANLFRFRRKSLYPNGERLKAATVASFSFDGSWDGLLWMIAGHETHLVADPVRRDVEALAAYVADQRIDYLDITPSYCGELLAAGLLDEGGHRPRLLVLAGEPVGEALWRRLRAVPGTESYNFYGPTECTVDSLVERVRDAAEPSIGRPLDGLRATVLDADLRPADEGELYVGGRAVARGYLDRPGLTAQRFVADPFGPPGSRAYRTGDLVRRTAGGGLAFVGRADDQVQVRGFRVEPGEVVAVLERHDAVERAVVVPGGDGLVARYTGTADPDDLRRHLGEVLPRHMVPTVITAVGRLPLTANGKLDRAALTEPRTAVPDGSRIAVAGREVVAPGVAVSGVAAPEVAAPAVVAPEVVARELAAREVAVPAVAASEGLASEGPGSEAAGSEAAGSEAAGSDGGSRVEVLRELFAEVLGLPSVRADGDFFDLGGHSLLATRLVDRIRRRFGERIPVAGVFDAPTPERLATRLGRGQAGVSFDVLAPLRKGGDGPPLFCVHPGGGIGWAYTGLLRHLDARHPVYALQARGLDPAEPMARSIAEMAADYRGQIRLAQPRGPYHLLGWSFGGVVAQEIATQLRREGEEVALLALLDSFLVPADHVHQPLADLDLRAALGEQVDALDDRQIAALGRVMANNGELHTAFAPSRFDGDVVFFHATEGKDDDFPTVAGWNPFLVGRVEVHDVPCRHGDMTTPAALDHIGPLLADRLSRAATGVSR